MSNSNKNVDYDILKDNIIKSCNAIKAGSINFEVDYDKLLSQVNDYGLTPAKNGLIAHRVSVENIPYLSEYFEKTHLSWITEERYTTVLTFFLTDDFDEKGLEILEALNSEQVDDPDNDKVADMSYLIANYPCYFATVISYRNDDPKRHGRPSYVIKCRANKIIIKSEAYKYNPHDMT